MGIRSISFRINDYNESVSMTSENVWREKMEKHHHSGKRDIIVSEQRNDLRASTWSHRKLKGASGKLKKKC